MGSVASKRYRGIYVAEIKANPHLFKIQVLSSQYLSRQDAYDAEDRLLRKLDAVRSSLYMNLRCASGLGYHPYGKESPRYHETHTAEARAKISAAHKGKKISDKQKAQISLAHKGKKFTDGHRQKISATMMGHRVSDDARMKMSEMAKKRRATPEQKAQRAEATKNCRWWTDGFNTKFCQSMPGIDWQPGRKKDKV